jgi:putative ABC transport system permease protein
VFSYIVIQRTREIGMRLALGAPRRDVLVLCQGLTLAAIGIGVGLTGALMAIPVTRKLLYGVSPMDPLTFGGVIILLVAVAALACCIPARRAMRIEPMTALRSE